MPSKNVREKNRLKKVRKHVFYILTKIVTKNGGKKKCETIFQEHNYSSNKKFSEKNRFKKVRKHVFYIHTNIMTKKWGEKTRETIFPETHE